MSSRNEPSQQGLVSTAERVARLLLAFEVDSSGRSVERSVSELAGLLDASAVKSRGCCGP